MPVLLLALLLLSASTLDAQPPAPPETSAEPVRTRSISTQTNSTVGSERTQAGTRPEDAEDLMLAAVRLIEFGSVNEAMLRLENLAQSHPYWLEPWLELAGLYAAEGRYDEAATALESALRADPSSRRAFESRLAVYRRLDADGSGTMAAPSEPSTGSTSSTTPASSTDADSMLTPMSESVSSTLVKTVAAWAIAWSDQNVDDFLSFYSDEFDPPRGQSLSNWRAERRDRIRRPSSISVTVSFVTPKFTESGRAEVYFVQTYRSNTYHDIVRKTLVMAEENGQWKIVEERVEE